MDPLSKSLSPAISLPGDIAGDDNFENVWVLATGISGGA